MRLNASIMYPKVEAWLESGKSRADYSIEIGVAYKNFCNWIKSYERHVGKTVEELLGKPTRKKPSKRKQKKVVPTPDFIPVKITDNTPKTGKLVLELHFPNGVKASFYDTLPVEYLQQLFSSC